MSLIAEDVEQFFIRLGGGVRISSSAKCLFSSLARFLIGLFVVVGVIVFLKFSVYSRYGSSIGGVVAKIFSRSVGSRLRFLPACLPCGAKAPTYGSPF